MAPDQSMLWECQGDGMKKKVGNTRFQLPALFAPHPRYECAAEHISQAQKNIPNRNQHVHADHIDSGALFLYTCTTLLLIYIIHYGEVQDRMF